MADYPTFEGGIIAQLPFTQTIEFRTDRATMDDGRVITAYNRAAPLRIWRISYPVFTDSEVATLTAFFVSMNGRLGEFTFRDPDDSNPLTQDHDHCRFGQDSLAIQQVGPDHNSTSVVIVEYSA